MTNDEFRACLRGIGLTPIKRSYEGSTLHQDAERFVYSIPDPETMNAEERDAFIQMLKARMGIVDH